ncbi:MAG: diadenylate cyclase CdaA, partial [Sulfobacillus sp.]
KIANASAAKGDLAMWLRIIAMGPGALIQNVLDILIVAYLFYRILLAIRGTRAFQLMKGIVVVALGTELSAVFGLQALHVVLETALVGLLVAIPVVFQPELRSGLERLGRARFLEGLIGREDGEPNAALAVEAVVQAALRLSRQRVGALMVLEGQTGLTDVAAAGTWLGAKVSWQILCNIFAPNTPLHDGAVIVRRDRVLAAACFLPLAATSMVASDLGTRHRAAIGASEVSDATVVVVSEETGAISVAKGGELTRYVDERRLRKLVESHLSRQMAVGDHRG